MRGTPAGRLKHQVKIVRQDATGTNEFGEVVSVSRTVATCWAAVEPLSARETIQSASNGLEISHRITMRYQSCVKSSDQILLNGRRFDISSIINVEEANTELQLLCTERKP